VAILLTCDCGRKLQIPEQYAGQQGLCPSCGRTLAIPFPDNTDTQPIVLAHAVEISEPAEDIGPAPCEKSPRPLANHVGEPLSEDADFFAPPPEEIGPIVSAHTTLRRTHKPTSAGVRLISAGVCGLIGLGIGAAVVAVFNIRGDFWQVLWLLGGGLAALGGVLWWTHFKHTCTYVGQEGIARFVCSGSREKVSDRSVFRFRDATELRTSQTLRYVNGVYQGTSYSFAWSDVGGRLRYDLKGTHRSEVGTPGATDPFQFARAAEIAWTMYLLGQVPRQIELAGSVAFNLKAGQWVRLGPGRILFGLGGEPTECSAADMEQAQVHAGVVRFKRKDAREGWFSSRGVYTFKFADLANAQLFFHLLEKLAGIPAR
jgi:hypothetical protein